MCHQSSAKTASYLSAAELVSAAGVVVSAGVVSVGGVVVWFGGGAGGLGGVGGVGGWVGAVSFGADASSYGFDCAVLSELESGSEAAGLLVGWGCAVAGAENKSIEAQMDIAQMGAAQMDVARAARGLCGMKVKSPRELCAEGSSGICPLLLIWASRFFAVARVMARAMARLKRETGSTVTLLRWSLSGGNKAGCMESAESFFGVSACIRAPS
ncbi:MAG: hypothetical protein FWD57_04220 [Polyangiaceae bacterium]|nr:hypothetical protein [Polyangiaceae bacterium]